jgi:hypothetical protein
MTVWALRVSLVVVMALLATPAWASHIGRRPLATEDTGTLEPGSVELEVSLDHERGGDGTESGAPGGPTVNVGLAPRLEVGAGTGFVVVDPDGAPASAGFGDTFLKVKYRLLDETPSRPAILAAVTTRLPTGDEDRGLGEPGVDVQAIGVVGKTFGALTINVNGGYVFVTDDRARDHVFVGASAEYDVSEAWTILTEVVGELSTARRRDDEVVLRAGAIWAVTERVKLDAAVGVGVTRAAPDLLLSLGLTILFNAR